MTSAEAFDLGEQMGPHGRVHGCQLCIKKRLAGEEREEDRACVLERCRVGFDTTPANPGPIGATRTSSSQSDPKQQNCGCSLRCCPPCFAEGGRRPTLSPRLPPFYATKGPQSAPVGTAALAGGCTSARTGDAAREQFRTRYGAAIRVQRRRAAAAAASGQACAGRLLLLQRRLASLHCASPRLAAAQCAFCLPASTPFLLSAAWRGVGVGVAAVCHT